MLSCYNLRLVPYKYYIYPSGYSRACKYFKRWISVRWLIDPLSARYALLFKPN